MLLQKKTLGYIEGWLSVVVNTLLFGLKYWIGIRLNSIAMVADAWHTLSDTLTSVVVILSFWIAARPPDEKHSFGHGRAESIGSIVIGTLLGVVGFGFFIQSIERLVTNQSMTFHNWALIVFLISVIVKEALAQFSFWAGKKTNSAALSADGWHHRSDAIASGLIVIGALAGRHWWWIDGVMGIGIAMLILYAVYDIMKTSINLLMGETPSETFRKQIIAAMMKVTAHAVSVHHLHIHKYGDHLEFTLHIRLPEDMRVDAAHQIASKIEATLRAEFSAETTVHVEPITRPGMANGTPPASTYGLN
ncbi:cation diffusion facilitator family transporter [candidate division KSB1 bacterium]|nr:cation diffusion facilitator family transporter [candidate division KSB1 bacterium]